MNVNVMQDILGHKDISTTMNIYADVTRDLKKVDLYQNGVTKVLYSKGFCGVISGYVKIKAEIPTMKPLESKYAKECNVYAGLRDCKN